MPVSKDPKKILTALQAGQYRPCYFLQGEETYYIDEITNYIEKNALSPENRALNLYICYGREQTLSQVLSRAKAMPMWGARQVVIVKEAQNLQDLQRPTGQCRFIQYLERPNPQTILVLAHKYKTITAKTFQQVFSQGESLLFTAPKTYDRHVPEWIQYHLEQRGYAIVPQAITILQNLLGTNLALLANELGKITLNLPKGAQISADDVMRHVGMQKEMNVFALQDAIASRQCEKALEILHYLSQNPKRNPAILTVNILATFFCKLLRYHYLTGQSPQIQGKTLQVHPYFLKNYQKAARCHAIHTILGHLQALHQADLQLKGIENATIQEGEVLKTLVVRLLTPKPLSLYHSPLIKPRQHITQVVV